MEAKKKKDVVRIIGISVFLTVAVISFLYANTGLFDAPETAATEGGYIDFIDCGQGDSCLIVSGDSVTLIDASTGAEAEKVIAHLQKRGVKKIDHFVLTHPHEDHIGGAGAVLDAFTVENIYMQRPAEGTEPTTSVYLNLLKKIKSLGLSVTATEPGQTFPCGAFTFTVLGPLKDYQDLNNQSVVLKAVCGKISVLFTGDQEAEAEKELVAEYGDRLSSTLLKAGHHGSSTSTCEAFLQAVNPAYAVISCSMDNSYGHPHAETLRRLEKHAVTYYRTDTQGTVSFVTDGLTLQYQEVAA